MEENLNSIHTIMNLPEERVTWVCYNNDMIPHYERMIKEIKGIDYFDKYVTVISSGIVPPGSKTYLDPNLFKLRGNGYD